MDNQNRPGGLGWLAVLRDPITTWLTALRRHSDHYAEDSKHTLPEGFRIQGLAEVFGAP